MKCKSTTFERFINDYTQCRLDEGHEGDHDDGALTWSSTEVVVSSVTPLGTVVSEEELSRLRRIERAAIQWNEWNKTQTRWSTNELALSDAVTGLQGSPHNTLDAQLTVLNDLNGSLAKLASNLKHSNDLENELAETKRALASAYEELNLSAMTDEELVEWRRRCNEDQDSYSFAMLHRYDRDLAEASRQIKELSDVRHRTGCLGCPMTPTERCPNGECPHCGNEVGPP